MEDFGYKKDDAGSKFSDLTKRVFLIGATLFSIAFFGYVTLNAYYFVYQDKNSDIEIIKAEEGPIKVLEENNIENKDALQIDRSIYEDIFGNKKESLKGNPKIRNAPEPVLPPKAAELDRRLIKSRDIMLQESVPDIESPAEVRKAEAKKAEPRAPDNKNDKQKIIIYSETAKPVEGAKAPTPTQDLLTKTDGETRAVKAKPTPPTKSEKRAVHVQVAAMTSKSSAQEQWDKLNRLYPSLFSGLKSFTEEVNLGKRGVFYRLQIGNFYNQIEAEEFCNRYVAQTQKSKADCIVVE